MSEEIQRKIEALEQRLADPNLWQIKEEAQKVIEEHRALKEALAGENRYDKGNAIMTLFAGAGGEVTVATTTLLPLLFDLVTPLKYRQCILRFLLDSCPPKDSVFVL